MRKKRKKRRKNRKKGSITWLKKECDNLFSEIVRNRGFCRKSGTRKQLQCAHIVSRSYKVTRWNLDNAFCLSKNWHAYFTWRPLEWEMFVIQQIGRKKYEDLKKLALTHLNLNYKKRTKEDYEKLYEELKKQID